MRYAALIERKMRARAAYRARPGGPPPLPAPLHFAAPSRSTAQARLNGAGSAAGHRRVVTWAYFFQRSKNCLRALATLGATTARQYG